MVPHQGQLEKNMLFNCSKIKALSERRPICQIGLDLLVLQTSTSGIYSDLARSSCDVQRSYDVCGVQSMSGLLDWSLRWKVWHKLARGSLLWSRRRSLLVQVLSTAILVLFRWRSFLGIGFGGVLVRWQLLGWSLSVTIIPLFGEMAFIIEQTRWLLNSRSQVWIH